MIREISTVLLLGQPLLIWPGVIAVVFLVLTFSSGFLNKRGIRMIPFKYHPKLAYITIIFGIIHVIMSASVYLFNF